MAGWMAIGGSLPCQAWLPAMSCLWPSFGSSCTFRPVGHAKSKDGTTNPSLLLREFYTQHDKRKLCAIKLEELMMMLSIDWHIILWSIWFVERKRYSPDKSPKVQLSMNTPQLRSPKEKIGHITHELILIMDLECHTVWKPRDYIGKSHLFRVFKHVV